MFWSEESVMRGGSTDNPGKRLLQLTGLNPQALAECSRGPPTNTTG